MSTELATIDRVQLPAPTTYRDYPTTLKADALLALSVNNGNLYKTAKELNIPENTLRYWVEQENAVVREIREGRKGELAQQYEHVARVYLDRALEPDAIAKTSGYYAVVAAKQAVEASQLLRNLPTSIVATATVDDLRDLQLTAQQVAQDQQVSLYDAACRLAQELDDVPELASQLRAWAESELRNKQ